MDRRLSLICFLGTERQDQELTGGHIFKFAFLVSMMVFCRTQNSKL
jgi:hypothetical protein